MNKFQEKEDEAYSESKQWIHSIGFAKQMQQIRNICLGQTVGELDMLLVSNKEDI